MNGLESNTDTLEVIVNLLDKRKQIVLSEFIKLQEEVTNTRASNGGKCILCSTVFSLSKKKQLDFYEAMLNKKITTETILAVLRSWGVKTSLTSVTTHRNGSQGYAKHMTIFKDKVGR